ncbi:Hypothetical protein POVR1_LOCUS61 [uncultured virus]|nr:Hypothetical protein POVR1_LOCUS61 [uncultured virus]
MFSIIALGGVLIYYSIIQYDVLVCTLESIQEERCDHDRSYVRGVINLPNASEIGFMVNQCQVENCLHCQCNATVGTDYYCWEDDIENMFSCMYPREFIRIRLVIGALMIIVPIVAFFTWLSCRMTYKTVLRYEVTEADPLSGEISED